MNNKKFALLALLTFAFGFANADKVYQIAGKEYTCKYIYALDTNLSNGSIPVFLGWTDQDFDVATTIARECPEVGGAYNANQYVLKLLGEMKARVIKYREGVERTQARQAETDKRIFENAEERRRLAQVEADKRQDEENKKLNEEAETRKRLAQAEADKKEADSKKRLEIEACQAQKSYKLHEAQEAVIADIDLLDQYQREGAMQRKIAATSGVRDLRAERAIGEGIYFTKEAIKSDFARYKEFGGRAASPSKVTSSVANPCPPQ
jgi:hypothetical protein